MPTTLDIPPRCPHNLGNTTTPPTRSWDHRYPQRCGQNDTCLCKHYLPATLLAGDNYFAVISGIQSVPGIVNFFGYYGGYIKAYGYMFASALHLQSCWVVVLVTLQRYIAVCRPHHAKKWASIKAVRYQVTIIVISTCLFYWPIRPFQRSVYYNEAKKRYDAKWTEFGASFSYRVGYMVIAYYLLGYVIPLSILVFTTYKLIKSLKELQDRKKEMTSSSKGGKDEVTMSLIIVVIVFTLCQLTNPVSKTLPGSECLFKNYINLQKS